MTAQEARNNTDAIVQLRVFDQYKNSMSISVHTHRMANLVTFKARNGNRVKQITIRAAAMRLRPPKTSILSHRLTWKCQYSTVRIRVTETYMQTTPPPLLAESAQVAGLLHSRLPLLVDAHSHSRRKDCRIEASTVLVYLSQFVRVYRRRLCDSSLVNS